MAEGCSKERPDENTHPYPCKMRQGNKMALIYISEEQFTSRDLLIMLSQGRLCVTAAFCLFGNTFKKKTKPEYTEHPLQGLVCTVMVNVVSLFPFVL